MTDPLPVQLIECPRDAMQGWPGFIPTADKIAYIRSLLKVGFHSVDFGSFVSPKAIPQMADTAEVIRGLQEALAAEDASGKTELLAIVANLRGAEDACQFEGIGYIGFPFSVSETFQQRNTHSGIQESLERIEDIQNLCTKKSKQLVAYISMGFGNPYGDPYSEDIVFEWVNKLVALDIGIVSLADTVGLAEPEQVYDLTSQLVDSLPGTTIGVHLHSRPENQQAKLEAAVRAGCRRFDGALKGIGGCPMANDELVGNMNSEYMISYLEDRHLLKKLDRDALANSLQLANQIFI